MVVVIGIVFISIAEVIVAAMVVAPSFLELPVNIMRQDFQWVNYLTEGNSDDGGLYPLE
jgi:hypothetical protein